MTIKTQKTEKGSEYFIIYEVRAVTLEDDIRIVLDRYSNKKKAEEYKEFCYEVYEKLYSCIYVYEVTVWVK